jgi:hypothetical protein
MRAEGVSQRVIKALQSDSRFEVTRVPNGTNIFYLRLMGFDPQIFQQRAQAGFVLTVPRRDRSTRTVNETWGRATAEKIVARLA